LRNFRVFEEVDLELPSNVIGIFGPNGGGKCVPGWVRIFDAETGEALPLERFVRERRKKTLGLSDGRIEPLDVTDWFELGSKPTVQVTLANGSSYELANTHPVLTDKGCVPAGALSREHWVAEARVLPACGPPRISADEALLIGMLLGDGTLSDSVSLSATEPTVIDLFRSTVERLFPGCKVHSTERRRSRSWVVVSRLEPFERRSRIQALARRLIASGVPLHHYLGVNVPRFIRGDAALTYENFVHIEEEYGLDLFEDRCALYGGRVFLEWARGLGLLGTVAATKHVPHDLLLLPDEQVHALLAGLWLTDGWVIPSNADVALGTNSLRLAKDVRVLLLRLGIQSTITVQRRPSESPHYRVNVTKDGARRFDKIPLVGPKAKKVHQMLRTLSLRRSWPNKDLLPPSFNEDLPSYSQSRRYRTKAQLARHAMSREVFLDFGGEPAIANAETAWSRIESVTPTGRKAACFDITVDSDEHLYLADTLIVHNSSLLESVLFGLYGRARTSKDQIRTQGILTDCAVRLVFDHGGQQYEVRRTIKGKNHQNEAELFVADRQLAAGVTEVDAEIERLLRMDQQVFRASVFAEQKQLDAFSDVTKGKRKEMVLRLLGIRPVDDARSAARKEARDTKANSERLAGALPDLTEQENALAQARKRAEEAERRAAEAEEALREADARTGTARDAFDASDRVRQQIDVMAAERRTTEERASALDGQRTDLEERIAALRRDLETLPALDEERGALEGAADRLASGRRLAEVAQEITGLESEIEGLPDVDPSAALAELEAAEAEREAAREEAARARSTRDRARDELRVAEEALARAAEADPSQPCPTCGRPLGDDFQQYVAHCRDEVAGKKRRDRAASEELKRAERVLKSSEERYRQAVGQGEDARKAAEARSNVDAQLGKARSRLEGFAEPFEGEIPNLSLLEGQAARAREVDRRLSELRGEGKHLAQAEKDLGRVVLDLGKCTARIEELDREAAALAFDPEDHSRLRKERDESERLLEQARATEREAAAGLAQAREEVGRLEGALVQARETAEKVEHLREEARYLERVSLLLNGFRDHLVSRIGPELSREAEALFRDLTNHEYEDLRIDEETLAIHIADGGRFFPIERFSGSEADLANLALRVAISMHLSRVSGADIGMMVLDEVLGSLDVERKDLFVQAMGRLASRFHQLFVITHAEQVKDQFPASIEVRKVGRRRSTAMLV